MHFCPRPKCSKWFHETCLLHHARTHPQQTDFVGSLAIRRLAVDPDKSCPHPHLARFAYTKPGWGKSPSAHTLSTRAVLTEALGPGAQLALPDALLAVALSVVAPDGRLGSSLSLDGSRSRFLMPKERFDAFFVTVRFLSSCELVDGRLW